jgi:hypothetical protein
MFQDSNERRLEAKLDDIRSLYKLIGSKTRRPNRRSIVVQSKFQSELDGVIDRLEELYYKYFIKGKSIKRLQTQIENDIAMSHTMKSIMPYAIALGMLHNGGAGDGDDHLPAGA